MKRRTKISPKRQRGNVAFRSAKGRGLDERNGNRFNHSVPLTLTLSPQGRGDKKGTPLSSQGRGDKKGVPLTLALSPQGRGDKKGVPLTLALSPQGRGDKTNRQGMTLLEVVLALTIFVGAMAVLAELVSTGQRASLQSRMQTIAIVRAEAQMNEVVANPSLMVSTAAAPFAEEYNPSTFGQWTWSLNVQSWDQNTNLLLLELTVTHLTSQGAPNATYTLRRYVRDPAAAAATATETTEETLF